MDMTLIETGDIYYNTRVYFRKNFMNDLPSDDLVLATVYHQWLKSQGCTIIRFTSVELLRDSLGIAPHYDKFGFKNPEDATMFILRWS